MQEHPLRSALLIIILAVAIVCNPPLHRMVRHGWRAVVDLFDGRPGAAVLIVGNSRVYANDMPFMIRSIADAAGDPVRWDVTALAKPGATFKSHWSDPDLRTLLTLHWDLVVLQAESAAQYGAESSQDFRQYGRRIVEEARKTSRQVALVVGWVYDLQNFPDSDARNRMDRQIQAEHQRFADDNRIDLINVGRLWRKIEALRPALALTADGNHPSLAGSYLEASAIYRYLSEGLGYRGVWLPRGIDATDGEAIAGEVAAGISPRPRLRAAFVP